MELSPSFAWYSASVAIRCWMVFTWWLIASVGELVSPSIDSCSRAPSFPTPRVLPFLSSPAFCRYYGGAQTPFPPALARTYLAAQSRGVGLAFIVPSVADWLVGAVDVVSRYRPGPGVGLWCGPGLPCFMVSLLMVCPVLRARPCPRTSLIGLR